MGEQDADELSGRAYSPLIPTSFHRSINPMHTPCFSISTSNSAQSFRPFMPRELNFLFLATSIATQTTGPACCGRQRMRQGRGRFTDALKKKGPKRVSRVV
jgi:hypothetical protein